MPWLYSLCPSYAKPNTVRVCSSHKTNAVIRKIYSIQRTIRSSTSVRNKPLVTALAVAKSQGTMLRGIRAKASAPSSFLATEASILIAAISVAAILKSRKLFHQTYKIFFQAVIFECFSLLFMCTAYALYAHNGVGSPMLKYLSQICRQMAVMFFLLLLLLLSKGFTITRGRLSLFGITKLSLFVFFYAVISSSMLIWQERIFDPALVTYVSECLPAYIIAIMRIVAWLWFLRSVVITCSKYEQKKRFYTTFSFLMTFWFWSGPVVLVLANFVLDNWVREEVVNGVECAVVAYGFLVFLVMTWPSAANQNFPYHVRTTQVGDTNYPQNNYEVRYTTNGADVRIEGHGVDENSDQSSVQREDSSSSPEIRHIHKVVA
uniref:GpcrRhopsn4 domain-containing protein n=1 Tax=Steinernema glaseri TaxID=37863 RepID=A0A1I7Z367_9BILA